ncbi:MAG: DUF4860 domain-containing protein [Peptococcaceae bacterium]|nr:DUF4860 domain-containing protein [Peptococcaceae bacterium]
MQRMEAAGRIWNTVFVLLLFCVFTLTVGLTLILGADAYQSIHQHMEAQYDERTGPAYLEAKVHHYDKAGAVQLEQFAGSTALALYEEIDGKVYKTLIYYYDGYIRELFFEDELAFQAEDGQRVLLAQDLSFHWAQTNLLQIVCTTAGSEEAALMVYLHSGEEVTRDV